MRKAWKSSNEYSVHKPVGEWIYGVQCVSAALKANKRTFYNMFLKNEIKPAFEPLVQNYMDITGRDPLLARNEFFGNILQDNNHQGIVLDVSPVYPGVIDNLNENHIDKDPHNLGAIIRNCVFYGVGGVVLSSKHATSLTNAVARVSSGALEFQDVYEAGNMRRFLMKSKEFGWQVIGTSCSNINSSLSTMESSKPTIVVFGNEGAGLPESILQECDKIVSIPSGQLMDSTITSLNVRYWKLEES